MQTQISFADHEGFQRNALYLTVAGAGAALVGLFLQGFSGVGIESISPEFLFGAAGMGMGAMAGFLQDRWSSIATGSLMGLAGGIVLSALGALSGLGGLLIGAGLAGGVLGALFGPERAPRTARAVGTALVSMLGMYVAYVLVLSSSSLSWLSLPGVREAAAGGILGLFASLGGAVGRVQLDSDPVRHLWIEARDDLQGDMEDLAARGVELYDEITTRIRKRRSEGRNEAILNDTERIASETTLRLIRLAQRWCTIEDSVDNTARPRLLARLAALDEKVRSVRDSVVRAEYAAAAQSIRRQLSGFEKIDVARERLVARLHHCLTSLEQVSLTLLQLSTTDAQHASLSLQPELERLDEMSEEFSWQSLSVDDLYDLSLEDAKDTPHTHAKPRFDEDLDFAHGVVEEDLMFTDAPKEDTAATRTTPAKREEYFLDGDDDIALARQPAVHTVSSHRS